ncbi:MAG: hypothetical protein ACYS9X_33060 [Planctomycetota bacterium]|jgi:hypothetical protein
MTDLKGASYKEDAKEVYPDLKKSGPVQPLTDYPADTFAWMSGG